MNSEQKLEELPDVENEELKGEVVEYDKWGNRVRSAIFHIKRNPTIESQELW